MDADGPSLHYAVHLLTDTPNSKAINYTSTISYLSFSVVLYRNQYFTPKDRHFLDTAYFVEYSPVLRL